MNIFEKAIVKMEKMQENENALMTPNTIIGLAIAVIVAAAVLPDAISTLFAVNTTGWSTGATALWGALPIIIIAAIVVGFYTAKKGQ